MGIFDALGNWARGEGQYVGSTFSDLGYDVRHIPDAVAAQQQRDAQWLQGAANLGPTPQQVGDSLAGGLLQSAGHVFAGAALGDVGKGKPAAVPWGLLVVGGAVAAFLVAERMAR